MLSSLTATAEYQDWQWQLAERLRTAIENVLGGGGGEVPCVQAMVQAMDGAPSVCADAGRRMSADVEGAFVDVDGEFIHGKRSEVKFSVGGQERRTELADLLVLASYVQDNKLRCQRACFVQAKRESPGSARSAGRLQIDEWQLSLLDGFPPFRGVSGFFRGRHLHLRNCSGMLGAYGLLAAPGGFSLVSARILKQVLGGRKSLTNKDLVPALISGASSERTGTRVCSWPCWLLDPDHCPECREIAEHWLPIPWRYFRHHHRRSDPDGVGLGNGLANSVLSCIGLDEFVRAWSGLRLGEVWRAGVSVASDRSLYECMLGLVSRIGAATGRLRRLRGLLLEASGGEPPERPWGDDAEESPSPGGGLGVLSLVVTSSPGE